MYMDISYTLQKCIDEYHEENSAAYFRKLNLHSAYLILCTYFDTRLFLSKIDNILEHKQRTQALQIQFKSRPFSLIAAF